jgi:hypothetical protein
MKLAIQNKHDIVEMLLAVRRDIANTCASHFNRGWVTLESWEASPSARISYHKSKITMLKAAGVMKDPAEYEYGWHFPNAYYADVNNKLTDADKQLARIIGHLQSHYLRPKESRFSDTELSRFRAM